MSNATNNSLTSALQWSEMKNWCIVYGVEAFVTIVANAITALVIINSSFLHKRFYYLLLSLAVADFLVGAVACPMFIYVLWGFFAPEGIEAKIDPKVVEAQVMIEIFTSYASIYGLVAIAMERLIAIMWPRFQQSEAKISYITAIIITWLLALMTCFLRLLKYVDDPDHYNKRAFVAIMVFLSLSLLIVFVCYTIIAFKLCSTPSDEISSVIQKEYRIALTLLVASVLFIALWLPFQVANYMYFFDTFKETSLHFIYASKFLHYFNSIINPFIYALMMKEFRKGFKQLFCCSNENEEPRGSGHVKPVSGSRKNQGYDNDDVTMSHVI